MLLKKECIRDCDPFKYKSIKKPNNQRDIETVKHGIYDMPNAHKCSCTFGCSNIKLPAYNCYNKLNSKTNFEFDTINSISNHYALVITKPQHLKVKLICKDLQRVHKYEFEEKTSCLQAIVKNNGCN